MKAGGARESVACGGYNTVLIERKAGNPRVSEFQSASISLDRVVGSKSTLGMR